MRRLMINAGGPVAVAAAFALVWVVWLWLGTHGFKWIVYDEQSGAAPGAFQVPRGDLDKRGQLGDMFGLVGSLFAATSLAGVVITLYLQQRQLRQQQEEIDTQRLDSIQGRLEAANSALREMAEAYWSDSFQEARFRAWELVGVVGPCLSKHMEPLAEGHDPTAAGVALDALTHHIVLGTVQSQRAAVDVLTLCVGQLKLPVYTSNVQERPYGTSARVTVTVEDDVKHELERWVRSLVQVIDMFRRYSFVADTVSRVHQRLTEESRRLGREGDVDLRGAADFLFAELRWWGPPLTALLSRAKEEARVNNIPFQWYDSLLRYISMPGFDSFDEYPVFPAPK